MISCCRQSLLMAVLTLLLLPSCVTQDYDDRNCMGGLNVFFYSQTPCESVAAYPAHINDILMCVFDEDGVLVYHQLKNNIALSRDYAETVKIGEGLYTVAGWSGITETDYEISGLQDGVTGRDDLLFRLRRTQERANSIDGTRVYFGESPAVYVSEGKEIHDVRVNMLELTNRLTVIVEGLAGDISDYEIDVESDNGSMNLGGTFAPDDVIKYERTISTESGILNAEFTLLKLAVGRANTLVIRNAANGEELFRESLLGTLLLKNPFVNLDCDHDFTIRFTADDQCGCGTYTIMEIWVNNWLVHSYDSEM